MQKTLPDGEVPQHRPRNTSTEELPAPQPMSKLQWMRQVLEPSLAVLKKVLAGAIAYTASIKHLMLGHNLKVPRISFRCVCHWVFLWHLWRLKCSKESYIDIFNIQSRECKNTGLLWHYSVDSHRHAQFDLSLQDLWYVTSSWLHFWINAFQLASSLWFLLFYFSKFISAETLLAEAPLS